MPYLLALVLVLIASTAEAQLSVVVAAKNRHPNLAGNPQITVDALKEIAAEVHGGLYKKPSGNNCLGYSCDLICFKDGTGRDVFGDWENQARPQWPGPIHLDDTATRCELQIGSEPPPPEPPQPPPGYAELLAEIRKLNELLTLVLAQQGGIRDEIAAQTQAVVAATESLKAEIAKGIKVRF